MKNKKGFTLIELLVSFTLITIVSVSLFKTVLVIQQKAQKDLAYNQYVSFAATFNNTLEEDFTNDKIVGFLSCGSNCYDIEYEKSGVKRLTIDRDEKSISYGTIKEILGNNYVFYDDLSIELIKSYSTTENNYN